MSGPRGRLDAAVGGITAAGYTLGWRAVRAIPETAAAAAFAHAADLATRRNGPSVRQLRANLARVTGHRLSANELDDLVRAGMRSYARYWLETFRLPSMDIEQTLARVTTENWAGLQAAAESGRGVVFALPHSGNWDVAGLWLVQRGYRFSTVAERLQPESLFDQFLAYRESLGMRVLALTGGDQPVVQVLAERLRAGEVVCLVAERDLSRHGVQVDFFGEPTRMPAGPALLAATTGAALMPAHLFFTPNGWGQWIGDPIDLGTGRLRDRVQRGTQALADTFATRIAKYPQDWHMLQRLWIADLDEARLAPLDFGAPDMNAPDVDGPGTNRSAAVPEAGSVPGAGSVPKAGL